MDTLTPQQRHKTMQAIKAKKTKIEEMLAKELWKKGYRYKRNCSKVYGKPDVVFTKYKLAIFADSEFFHGKDWESYKHNIKSNRDFWYNKIESNIKRDAEVNAYLTNDGWKVLRFWGKDIKNNLEICIADIINEIEILKANAINQTTRRRDTR